MARRTTWSFVLSLAACMAAIVPAAASAAEPEWYAGRTILGSTPLQNIFWGELKLNSQALGHGGEGEIHCQNGISGTVDNEAGFGRGAIEGWGTNACKAPELEKALLELYKQPIEEGKIPTPITVYATSELPLEKEMREAEVCKEGAVNTEVKKCVEHGEAERKSVIFKIRRRISSFPWKMQVERGVREEEPALIDKIGLPTSGENCYPKEKVVVEENGEAKLIERPVSWTKAPSGCLKITVVAPQIPDEIVFYGTLEPTLEDGSKNGLFPSSLQFGPEAGLLLSNEGEAPETKSAGELHLLGEGMRLVTAN